MSIYESTEDAYYALRNYFTDDCGSLNNVKMVLTGISVPALALAGYMLMNDIDKPDNLEQATITSENELLVNSEHGSASHANVSFSYVEQQDPDKMVSNAMLKWSTVTESIPVQSESQCLAEGMEYAAHMNMATPGFAATIDCMDGNNVVSEFQCVVKPGPSSVDGNKTAEITCGKSEFMVLADRESDTPEIT